MKNSDELKDELNDFPFLKKMKERQSGGFQVPKHYFKHLPDEVMRQAKQPVPVPNGPNWAEQLGQFIIGLLQPRYVMAFASVLVLVIAGVLLFGKKDGQIPQVAAIVHLEEIPDEELFAYVAENISEFDHELVLEASAYSLPEIASPSTPASPKVPTPKPEVEEMENYIDGAIDEIDVEDLEDLL